ncbi:translation initiation factor eIF-2B subunit alpha [Rhodotorula sphaerocarpa]
MSADSPADAFDPVKAFGQLLERDDPMPAPVAAVETLAELVSRSDSSTIQELLALLRDASSRIAAASFNPVSAQSGTALFMRYLTLQRPPPEMSFAQFKRGLVTRAREFVNGSGRCRDMIAAHMGSFIQDGHRVVVQALLNAAQNQKKRFQVYVTESRPFGLGLKTHAILTEAGIPCVVVLDSAVAYVMAKCDLAVVGAEAVCESGGLINFIGGYQMAIAAKAMGKPFYALAESFKFTRLFPLGQYDIPSSLPAAPLSFPEEDATASSKSTAVPPTPVRPMTDSKMPVPLEMTDEGIRGNPILDYTTPDHISLIVSDVGVLTPSGVSDALLAIFAE